MQHNLRHLVWNIPSKLHHITVVYKVLYIAAFSFSFSSECLFRVSDK